jgi:histidinol-phosphate aminotransferase
VVNAVPVEAGENMSRIEDRIARLVRPEIRALSAYHVPEAEGLVKLDAMENPYHWPDGLVDEWLGELRGVELNRYPHPGAPALTERLREAMNVPGGMDILLGNGSDEIIQMVIMALDGPVLAPEPTFVMYRMIARFLGREFIAVPLADDFSLDVRAMRAAIAAHEPAVVFLAYPNNPTGNLFDTADMRALIAEAPGLVVVDEAYAPFAEASFMASLGEFDNLVVMRTVSKLGLAGLRLGLLAGAPQWIGEFDKVRLPYNINVLTQVSGEFALCHQDVFDAQTAAIRAERGRLLEALRSLDGLRVFDSRANFILFRAPAGRADGIFDALKGAGVLIKNLNGAGAALADCLRVTVGRPEENDAFLHALRAAL